VNMSDAKIARVFPSRTKATPTDDLAFTTGPPLWRVECDVVHVSCTFTWERNHAAQLAKMWEAAGYAVETGGPAFDAPGADFVPGRYLRPGYVITSRGCRNRCWFCYTWAREGDTRELPITDGFNVLDSNLLQCKESHIRAVFAMLEKQDQRPAFTGGLEASLLEDWHIDLLLKSKPTRLYFAYDTPDDLEPLIIASRRMFAAGFTVPSHTVFCYVLIGYPGDTPAAAKKRLLQVLTLGVTPMAMYWRGEKYKPKPSVWSKLQKQWARPVAIYGGGK